MKERVSFRAGGRHFTALYCAVIALLVILAWSSRFIQDDAFISFLYADNLARGDGIVWNEQQKVEGL